MYRYVLIKHVIQEKRITSHSLTIHYKIKQNIPCTSIHHVIINVLRIANVLWIYKKAKNKINKLTDLCNDQHQTETSNMLFEAVGVSLQDSGIPVALPQD